MPAQDRRIGLFGAAFLIGVLDAQNEDAALAAGVQPVEQGGAGAAHVQETGGTGRETDAGCIRIAHERAGPFRIGISLRAPGGVAADWDSWANRFPVLDRIQEGGQLPQVHTVHCLAGLVEVRTGGGQSEELLQGGQTTLVFHQLPHHEEGAVAGAAEHLPVLALVGIDARGQQGIDPAAANEHRPGRPEFGHVVEQVRSVLAQVLQESLVQPGRQIRRQAVPAESSRSPA